MNAPTKRIRKNRWQKTLERVEVILLKARVTLDTRANQLDEDPAADAVARFAVADHRILSALREIEQCNAGEDEAEEVEGGAE